MTAIDFTRIEIQKLITHHIGNKLRNEKFILSEEITAIDDGTKDFLLKHFLLPIKAEEFFSFSHAVDLNLNEVYTISKGLFSKPKSFINSSKNLAKLLYEQSMHPKIREGELNIVYFSNVLLDDKIVDAIGIFKSETHIPYLKMRSHKSKFNISLDYGFEIKGLDKGCIVFNIDQKNGYKLLIVDNANKSTEAQYWKDDFLKIKAINNEFYQTNEILGITKNFVTEQLSQEFELSKVNQIDLLNRSVEYFQSHESFNKREFESTVLQDSPIIRAFRKFDTDYREGKDIDAIENFTISKQAVKKQARIFKSVLKLDKNFHIYIHGNHELIEQGVEKDGRKFYKIYFQQES